MIDSHCHLADKQFDTDRDAVIQRAIDAGVTTMICVADSLEEGEKCLELTAKYPSLFCTIGVHPHNAKDWDVASEAKMLSLIGSSKRVVAVGEIGLDYHYDNSPRDVQRDVFKGQLLLAKKLNLPAVVHNRESIADLKVILDEADLPKMVLHCCTEKWSDVSDLVERGYLLSFTGIATYPSADDIRETIRQCPLEQMMIETDAPYLAPVPHRGKRNEPAYVAEVAKLITELKNISAEDFETQVNANTVNFFGLPALIG